MRKTAGSVLYQHGVNKTLIQRVTGHSTDRALESYMLEDTEMLKATSDVFFSTGNPFANPTITPPTRALETTRNLLISPQVQVGQSVQTEPQNLTEKVIIVQNAIKKVTIENNKIEVFFG